MSTNREGNMLRAYSANGIREERGFTMVEALVALVVLSIGLLGIAALYLDSLRAGRDALLRTQALNLASDLADRVRANRLGEANYAILAAETAAVVAACKTTAGCTPADLAVTDLAEWKNSIGQLLPDGTGEVRFTAAIPNRYDIVITWTQPGSDVAQEFATRVEI